MKRPTIPTHYRHDGSPALTKRPMTNGEWIAYWGYFAVFLIAPVLAALALWLWSLDGAQWFTLGVTVLAFVALFPVALWLFKLIERHGDRYMHWRYGRDD